MNNQKIIAILAAYNLENTISEIVDRTKIFVNHVIVVTDGSTDSTAVKAISSGAIIPETSMKRGKGYAVIKGIEESKKYNPDIIVLLDADGQHLPEEIPLLLNIIKDQNVDLVIGSRMLGQLKTSKINKFGNLCLKIISSVIIGKWITDTESGFKAIKANSLYQLNLKSTGYEIESEFIFKSIYKGFKIKEVPITVPFIIKGITVKDGLKVGWYKIKLGLKLKIFSDK